MQTISVNVRIKTNSLTKYISVRKKWLTLYFTIVALASYLCYGFSTTSFMTSQTQDVSC